jgi:peptidyl-tRNA hydrolase
MAIENKHDFEDAALLRAVQDDPWQMHLIVRKDREASAEELIAAAMRATLDCVEKYEEDPDHAEAFAAWFALSFRKVTLRAKEGEWKRLLEEQAGVADRDELVFVMPPMQKSAREPFLKKLQVYNVEIPPLPGADKLPAAAMRLLLNGDAGMSLGKAIAQASHAVLILFRHLHDSHLLPLKEELGVWEEGERKICVGLEKGERFREIDNLPYVARVRDAGLTEVVPGTHTVLIVPPGAEL